MNIDINKLISDIKCFTDDLFYIGQTSNPERRIKEHYRTKGVIELIYLYNSDKSTIDHIEQTLIKHFSTYDFNMNLSIKDQPKNIKTSCEGTQYIYIALKTINLNIPKKYKDNALFIVSDRRIKVLTYNEYLLFQESKKKIDFTVKESGKHVNNSTSNTTPKNQLSNKIVHKKLEDYNYQDELQKCINKINPILLQKTSIYKYFHICRTNDYNNKKLKLQLTKSIKEIKHIKKSKCYELINKLKYDLYLYYQHNNNIKLKNKNKLFEYIYKNHGKNLDIYIYFE